MTEQSEAENAAMARSAAEYCRTTTTHIPNIEELSADDIVWNLRFMAYCAGYLAAWSAPKWISLKERLPTKEEMEGNCIEWWHDFECCPFSGRYESYDGKRIWVGTRYQWCGAIPLSEFSYWRIVQEPAAPKEEK